MTELQGHVAFVTGAGRGIGQATALLLASRGASVGVCDRDDAAVSAVVAEIKAKAGAAYGYVVDVGEREAMLDAVGRFTHECGGLDSLVTSAMWIRYEPLEDIRDEVIDRMFAVGLKAALWAAQAAQLAMQADRGGSLVTFASPVADRGHRGTAVYTAVKGAVAALTRQLAMELAPRNIRVNAVTPGSTVTPGAKAIVDDAGWEIRRRATPLGRLGQASDIAEAVAFLVSPRATFVTGEILHVDGGLTAGAF